MKWLKKYWLVILLSIAISVLVFLVIDALLGSSKHLECVVAEHIYVSSWTEIQTRYNDKTSYTVPVYHPEEYKLVMSISGEDRQITMNVSSLTYNEKKDGQQVTVRVCVGKFTGINWPISLSQ